MSVRQLIDRIRADKNDRQAKDELYRILSDALLDRIRNKIPPQLRPRLDAEDALNHAFERATSSLDRFQETDEQSFLRWTYTIAKNYILDQYKRRSVHNLRFVSGDQKGPHLSQIVPRKKSSGLTQVMWRDWIENVLQKLTPKEAEVIRLHALHGYSYETIAESWKKTPGAVQRFYSRAWQRLVKLAHAQ